MAAMTFHIHRVTLSEFTKATSGPPPMASEAFCAGPGRRISEGAFARVLESAPSLEGGRVASAVPGFSVAWSGRGWGDGVICLWEDATGRVVGGQAGGVPYVLPEYRGLKLGREIALRAFETGLKKLSDGVFFSPEGLAARRSAHRFAVERAIGRGLAVPAEVLADYPDLAPAGKRAGRPPLDADLLRAFAAGVRDKYGLERFDLSLTPGGDIKLDTLIVPKGERKQGRGGAAVEKLARLADEYGRRVLLTPGLRDDRHGTTSRSRLVRFYRRFGFVENKGRAMDFTVSEGMIRRAAAPPAARAEAREEAAPTRRLA
jgi:GNAT superfamily N-acetyltransferase